MKKILFVLMLIFSIQTVFAEPIVVKEEKLANGETIRMCTFDDGNYGYCTEVDKQKAIYYYQSTKDKTKKEKFNDSFNNSVNTICNVLNGVRAIGGYLGI